MSATKVKFSHVPDHVPPELIMAFDPDAEPGFERDPYGKWMKLKDYPPIFYNPAPRLDVPPAGNRGRWVVTSSEYVREVFQKADPFSNSLSGVGDGVTGPRRYVPLAIDPPEHNKYRALIAPLFSPKNIDKLDAQVAQVTNEILDETLKTGSCDFMQDFARLFPGTIFMLLMGLPLDQKEQFFAWEEQFFHGETQDDKDAVRATIFNYLKSLIAEKRKNPGDDLVSLLISSKVDGESMPQEDIEDFCFLLYIAGLDTVNAGLGHIFKYLAEHPEIQKDLRENPDKIHGFVEEMLRVHAWVNTYRNLSRDYDFHGVQMKAGDDIMLNDFLASRDPAQYDKPDTVDITREPNPHFAFGGGTHRCAGSHLARRELRIAVREWVNRVPEFTITPNDEALYYVGGTMLALRTLPLSWDASKAK